jgi:type 1 glutamine amidotransferase
VQMVALSLSSLAIAADAPVKVVMFSGSSEYKSNDTLGALKKLLEEKHNCQCVLNVVEEKGTQLTGIEGLETADVAIFFTRRVSLAPDQLEKVKKFITAGKGVVGIRTASHGFQTWLEFDHEILGGSYNNHYGKDVPAEVALDEKGKVHPVLSGIKAFGTEGKLYKNPNIADDATVLLRAKTPEYIEPVAWARDAKAGIRGRVFYTSLGVPKDFDDPQFQQLLANAVRWASGK